MSRLPENGPSTVPSSLYILKSWEPFVPSQNRLMVVVVAVYMNPVAKEVTRPPRDWMVPEVGLIVLGESAPCPCADGADTCPINWFRLLATQSINWFVFVPNAGS